MLSQIFRRKSLDAILHEGENPEFQLKRVLGSFDVVLLGIGAIIGAGIFATIGTAAAGDVARPGAGPALILSFALTAVACGFAALCYAEFAAMVPISGSAYTYSYGDAGRAGGLDHRLGSDHRVCRRECRGGDQLGELFQDLRGAGSASSFPTGSAPTTGRPRGSQGCSKARRTSWACRSCSTCSPSALSRSSRSCSSSASGKAPAQTRSWSSSS